MRLRVRRPYNMSVVSRCSHLPIITASSLHRRIRQFPSTSVSPMRHSRAYLQSFSEICIPMSDIVAYKGRFPPYFSPQCCCSSSLPLLPSAKLRDRPYSTACKLLVTADKLVLYSGMPHRHVDSTDPPVTWLVLITVVATQAQCRKIQRQW